MIAVIGDIHGCFHTLIELVESIKRNYPGIKIYCVGDLVDRGNFSYETVDFVMNEGILTTSGNHDYMFYYFITDPHNDIGKNWIFNGYETTLASYADKQDRIVEHLNYIINLPLYINLPDCFISHAGISSHFKKALPPDPLSDEDKLAQIIKNNIQNEHGIIWNREELLDLGKLQVVGHTRQESINHLAFNDTVYIDTSVYTGKKLSAIIVDNGKIIDNLSVYTIPLDIKKITDTVI
jgi:serine/threonine protein phosphatase 1